jgi:hypothetical protein
MKNKKKKKNQLNTNPFNLYELFLSMKDFRRAQGRMHTQASIFIIMTMAMMSGCIGQRPTADFVRKHREDLIKTLKPKNNKLPSLQTIARVMQHADYPGLCSIFKVWVASNSQNARNEWIALDGKAIGGTVTDPHNAYQTYTNLVSVFSIQRKQVIAQGKVESKNNEIPLVKQLIKELQLEGVVFTLDALHCQRNTTKVIIDSKNHYVIGVKGNQKKLLT